MYRHSQSGNNQSTQNTDQGRQGCPISGAFRFHSMSLQYFMEPVIQSVIIKKGSDAEQQQDLHRSQGKKFGKDFELGWPGFLPLPGLDF